MRKLFLSMLLASAAATPALAAPRDHGDRQEMRTERFESRDDRQNAREERQQVREERSVQAERPHLDAPNAPRVDGNGQRFARMQRLEQNGQQVDRDSASRIEAWRAARQQRTPDNARDGRFGRRGFDQPGGLQQPNRPLPGVFRHRTPVVSDTPRVGTQPPMRVERRRSPEVRWSGNWRNDRRYDWRNWRDRHRSSFHLGLYYDPFGWGYQPYSIGWRMWPSYYGSNYWINDPWQYRLPYAPPGTRWVRYYNDAILVDTWSGQVVDVIQGFFW